ncbi:uncharacterized protein LOC129723623 isoform X2 [Wyeomyia smithii]|uniref:uncharacterized protein LOC129723623 isoform X2 n=1 Tax=Wyeomyia smithii TaxID=174621 RepID=UPI002467E3EC|nr:uncharacterized protein LOC129723623 isoform X2 [Wyeomyia smithii]
MKSSATVLILLIGLCCHSQPIESDSDERSPEESEAIERLRTKFENACIRNSGSEVTYAEVMEAVALMPRCLSGKINIEAILQGWMSLNNDTREGFFSEYCPVVRSSVVECLQPIESIALQCLESGDQRVESPDFPVYFLPQVLDLICENHGAILFANDSGNPSGCFQNYYTYIKSCMKNFVSDTNAKLRKNYTELECRVLKTSRECVADKLGACGNRDLIKIFDIPYQALVRETACKNVT